MVRRKCAREPSSATFKYRPRHSINVRSYRMQRFVPVVLRRLTIALVALFAPAVPLAAQRAPVIPGLDASAMDTTVRAGDDFYRYADGAWERRTQIPPEASSFSAFSIAAKQADANVMEIVHRAAAANAAQGTDERKEGDFYRAYLDTAAIAARHLGPLQPLLDSISAIANKAALARFLGAHLRADVDPINTAVVHTDNPFGLWVAQDFNHPGRNVASLMQGGIELPDRSYYLDASQKMADLRAAYRTHVAGMLVLAVTPNSMAAADSTIALETRIAQVHWKVEDTYDPSKGNNHWARADFARKAPGLDWSTFFGAAKLSDQDSLVAWQPSAITGIAALIGSQPPRISRHRRPRRGAAAELRPRGLCLLRQIYDRRRNSGVARPARRCHHERRARLHRRQDVRRTLLSAAGQGERAEDGRGTHSRVRAPHRRARLDGAVDQGRSEGQASHPTREHRLSRQVAELCGADRVTDRRIRKR
jgi:hypothetical protein